MDSRLMYRLPLTFVRIVGERVTAADGISGETHVSRESVVTTEVGADLQSLLWINLGTDATASRTLELRLFADGRLKGAEDSVTVDRFAAWAPFVRLSAIGLAMALPWLVPGAAGAAAATGALLASTAIRRSAAPDGTDLEEGLPAMTPDDQRLARYAEERKAAHDLLLALRAGLAKQEEKLAAAAGSGVRLDPLRKRMAILRRELSRAETSYQAFLHRYASIRTEVLDERLGVAVLPTERELRAWLDAGSAAQSVDWERMDRLVETVGVAVSVDLLDAFQLSSQVAERNQLYEPGVDDGVCYRRPRLGALRVWRVEAAVSGGAARSLELVEERRLLLCYPGNEEFLPLSGVAKTSTAVAVAFDDEGSLSSVRVQGTGPARQRAEAVSGIITAVTEGAAAGKDLRETLALPSLEEQVKAAENLRKLQPAEPVDPDVEKMLERIEEEERKARLRLATQLGTATSAPVVVTVRTD